MHKNFERFSIIFFGLGFTFLIFPQNAHAYIDPGTGSYILQLIIAGLVGALYAVKLFWARIKLFFTSLLSYGKKNERNDS